MQASRPGPGRSWEDVSPSMRMRCSATRAESGVGSMPASGCASREQSGSTLCGPEQEYVSCEFLFFFGVSLAGLTRFFHDADEYIFQREPRLTNSLELDSTGRQPFPHLMFERFRFLVRNHMK